MALSETRINLIIAKAGKWSTIDIIEALDAEMILEQIAGRRRCIQHH